MAANNARHATGATNSTNRIASRQILIVVAVQRSSEAVLIDRVLLRQHRSPPSNHPLTFKIKRPAGSCRWRSTRLMWRKLQRRLGQLEHPRSPAQCTRLSFEGQRVARASPCEARSALAEFELRRRTLH